MWEEIIQIAISSGIWAMLFCSLLVYQLKDGRKRESQYQETIERLSKGLEDLAKGWEGIKSGLEEINRDIESLSNAVRRRSK